MRVLLVVALVVAGVRVAEASCGSPHTALSPPSGASLPPHPTIYLFDTDHETNILDRLSISGELSDRIRFRATKLATHSNYTVHRIELGFLSVRERSIRVQWNGAPLATYVIADDPVVDQARVVDVTHETHYWTCSFNNTIEIAVEGNAIAYQIDWDDDRTTIVADHRLIWSDEANSTALLELGHPNCMSYTVEPELLGTARSFELYALFADGMVKRLGSSIAQLDDHGVRLPVELLQGADVRIPRHFEVAVTTSPHWVFAAGAAGGLVGALFVFVVGRRRRRVVESERLAPARWLDRT